MVSTRWSYSPHRTWLNARFPQRLILHRSDFPWPARSRDSSPSDFFLRSFVKERVFRTAPSNIAQLKNEVREVIASIDVNILQGVQANLVVHIDKSIESGGGRKLNTE